uniref:Uncharacterized protein n=1 Tax=Panagrolaimus superbus TaxID=310955 RepID=A0A914ZC20_9BILA
MLDLDDSIFKCWGTVVPQSCSQKTELKSPEKELPDYVWNFIKKDSKFVEIKILLFAVANVLENSRQNIIDTEDLAQREMRIQGMMVSFL